MFSPERFGRLARAHLAEHARGYAWYCAGVLLLLIVVAILMGSSERGFASYDVDSQEGIFYSGLYVFSIVFAGRYFQSMGQRAPALLALMRPASGFEKWLLAMLVVVVLFPLAYGLLFYVVDLPVHALAYASAREEAARAAIEFARHRNGAEPSAFAPEDYRLFLPWREIKGWAGFAQVGLLLSFAQGFAMFGSLFFRTVPFIKTLLSALVFLLLVALFASLANGNPDLVLGYWTSKRLMADWQYWAWGALWFAVPAMLWLSCYLSLREREITA
jgi:hypothetical protein